MVKMIKLSMNISIRSCQSGDDEDLVNLLDEVFEGWPKFDLPCSQLDHWRWKYRDNPLNIMIIGLATCNDEIIGCRHSLMQTLKIGKSLFLCTNGVDMAIRKEFRGIGLSRKMRAHDIELEKAAGVKLHYGVDANPIFLKMAKKDNYSFPFSLETMVRIRDIDLHHKMLPTENALLKKFGFYTLRAIGKFRTLSENFDGLQGNIKISEVQRFDEKIDSFLEVVGGQYEFMVVRDRVYLNWRYCDPRGGEYLVKIAVDQNRVLGYIVLRINKMRREYPVGYIVDLLASPRHLDVADELVRDGVEYFDNENVNVVQVHVLRNSLFEPLLQKTGFVEYMSKNYLNYSSDDRISSVDELSKSSVNTKHFVLGDFDWI